jgi:hypothetical protein
MTKELSALIERVEAAEGPDRRLDALITIAIAPDRQTIIGAEPSRFPQKPIYGPISKLIQMAEHGPHPDDAADFLSAPRYTASLDAALALVPERLFLCLDGPRKYLNIPTPVPNYWRACLGYSPELRGWGATPALALCAAALKARMG